MREGEGLILGRALGQRQRQPRARATARPRGLGETDNQPDAEDAADAAAEHARTDPVHAVLGTEPVGVGGSGSLYGHGGCSLCNKVLG